MWHFIQGYWYRLLSDTNIMEDAERSQGDIAKMRQVLREEHGITL